MANWKKRKRQNIEVIETTGEKVEKQKIRLTKFLKREIVVMVISVLAVTTVILGGSYAILTNIQRAEKYNVIKAGTLQIAYDDTSNGLGNIINLNGAYPESDEVGQSREPYRFKITNTGSLNAKYMIKLLDDTDMIAEDGCQDKLLDKSKIKYSINGGEPVILDSIKEEYIAINGSIGPLKSATYEIRMWIDESAGNEVLGRHYHGKIVVEAVQNEGEVNVPDKDGNMIAVVYNEESNNWVKADENQDWYNYDDGKWANAVTVSSETRGSYKKAKVGTIINMDDIETMWVWIPRYSYTIGSEDGTNYYGKQGEFLSSAPTQALPGEIDVKFISESTKDTGSAQYKVADGVSNWRTPDAFTFGDKELSGIWVGKFETSSSNPGAENGGGNTTELDPIIKPNVASWRNIQVATIGEVGRKVSASGNRYGFSNRMDSHAIKNDEWASVAYLSQSKYGKLGNSNFSGANKEIYQNKSDQYITGCSYGSPSNENTDYGCQYTYNIVGSGTGASTTGTIYGVYDMSGGSWEYVMGNINRYSGADNSYNSGYTGLLGDGSTITGKNWLDEKYYNFYETDNVYTACNGGECKSHGLSEVVYWYENLTSMGISETPWIVRGDSYFSSSSTGIFSFIGSSGHLDSYSFRLVLTNN